MSCDGNGRNVAVEQGFGTKGCLEAHLDSRNLGKLVGKN